MADTFTTFTWPATMSPASRAMLENFFISVVRKFEIAEAKHNWQDAWRDADKTLLQAALAGHVRKGDPIDVAIYCAICEVHGWPTYG
jgi:hypothetical protein